MASSLKLDVVRPALVRAASGIPAPPVTAPPDNSDADAVLELSDGTPLDLTQSVKYNTSGVNFTLACA